MDERNLLCRDTLGDQLAANIVIDGKGRFQLRQRNGCFQCMKLRIIQITGDALCYLAAGCRFWCGNITEHQLGQLLRFAVELEEYGRAENMPKLEGKRMTMMIAPVKKK